MCNHGYVPSGVPMIVSLSTERQWPNIDYKATLLGLFETDQKVELHWGKNKEL